MACNKGFTLVELMITIAIVILIASISTPAFFDWYDRTKVRGDATDLRSVFEAAKLRAIKHNTNVVVTFPNTTSFQAFIDNNDNGARDVDEDLLFDRTLTSGVTITANTFVGNDMAFNPRGMANGPNSTGTITMRSPRGKLYSVVVSSFGRVRMERL